MWTERQVRFWINLKAVSKESARRESASYMQDADKKKSALENTSLAKKENCDL